MLRLARNAALLLLRHRTRSLEEPVLGEARRVLQLEYEIKRRFEAVRDRRVATLRTRIHGDLHLGELLFTGKDFVIIDFEGQPQRALSERRIKRSPLRDVASMLRSFHYVSHAALFGEVPGVIKGAEQLPAVEEWARYRRDQLPGDRRRGQTICVRRNTKWHRSTCRHQRSSLPRKRLRPSRVQAGLRRSVEWGSIT